MRSRPAPPDAEIFQSFGCYYCWFLKNALHENLLPFAGGWSASSTPFPRAPLGGTGVPRSRCPTVTVPPGHLPRTRGLPWCIPGMRMEVGNPGLTLHGGESSATRSISLWKSSPYKQCRGWEAAAVGVPEPEMLKKKLRQRLASAKICSWNTSPFVWDFFVPMKW